LVSCFEIKTVSKQRPPSKLVIRNVHFNCLGLGLEDHCPGLGIKDHCLGLEDHCPGLGIKDHCLGLEDHCPGLGLTEDNCLGLRIEDHCLALGICHCLGVGHGVESTIWSWS